MSDTHIWTPRELEARTRHGDAHVRAWAFRRLRDVYPDGDWLETALAMLDDSDTLVRQQALNYVVESPPQTPAEPLKTLLERDDATPRERSLALNLLAARGDQRARSTLQASPQLFPTGWSVWARIDAAGFRRWMLDELEFEAYPADSSFFEAWVSVAEPSAASDLMRFVSIFSTNDARRRELLERLLGRASSDAIDFSRQSTSVESFVANLQSHLQSVAGAPDLEPAVVCELRAIDDALAAGGWAEALRRSLEVVDALLSEMTTEADASTEAEAVDWVRALVDPLEARLDQDGDSPDAAFPQVEPWYADCAASLIGGAICERATADLDRLGFTTLLGLWNLTTGAQLERIEQEIVDTWEAFDDEGERRAVDILTNWLRSVSRSTFVDETLPLLRRLEGCPTASIARNVIETVTDDAFAQVALTELLSDDPDLLRDFAERKLARDSRVRSDALVMALQEQPYRWASRLIVDRLDDLLEQIGGMGLWGALEELGDPETLERIVEAWEPNETNIALTAYSIGMLADRIDDLPDELCEEAEEASHAELLWGTTSGDPAGGHDLHREQPTSLHLPLRCLDCGHTYEYEVDVVYIDPSRVRGQDSQREWTDVVIPSRVIECRNCGAVDRYEAGEGFTLEVYPALTLDPDEEPEDARVVYTDLHLPDGTAVRRPSRALERLADYAEHHPKKPDAWLELAEVSEMFGEYGRARQALDHLNQVAPQRVEQAFESSLKVIETTRNPEETRVDRDSPCPCGSGRKYKHCCMEKYH